MMDVDNELKQKKVRFGGWWLPLLLKVYKKHPIKSILAKDDILNGNNHGICRPYCNFVVEQILLALGKYWNVKKG